MANDKLELDLAWASTPQALHEILAAALGFPDYYGKNWDAFDECINDPDVIMPRELTLKGLAHLGDTMPREAEILRKCLGDMRPRNPEVTVILRD